MSRPTNNFRTAINNPNLNRYWCLNLKIRGEELLLSETEVDIYSSVKSIWLHFQSGLNIDTDIRTQIDLDNRISELPSVSIQIAGGVNIDSYRNSTRGFGLARGELSLWIDTLNWEDRLVIISGYMRDISWGGEDESFEFTLVDDLTQFDPEFPANIITQENFPFADDSAYGKPYPIIYGYNPGIEGILIYNPEKDDHAKNPNLYEYLVCGHSIAKIYNVYKNDLYTPLGDRAWWSLKYDNKNNPYMIVTINSKKESEVENKDAERNPYYVKPGDRISIEMDGKINSSGGLIVTPGEIIEDIIANYTNLNTNQYDNINIGNIKARLNLWKFSSIFNDRDTSLNTIDERIIKYTPIVKKWSGGKLSFSIIDYHSVIPIEHLESGLNVYGRVSKVSESSITDVYNSFEVKYGYNSRFNDFTKVAYRNANNSMSCALSESWYGKRVMEIIEVTDIFDDITIELYLEYLVRLYTSIRLIVEYECYSELEYLQEGDIIELTDSEVGFSNKKFIVISIQPKLNSIILQLSSIEDLMEKGNISDIVSILRSNPKREDKTEIDIVTVETASGYRSIINERRERMQRKKAILLHSEEFYWSEWYPEFKSSAEIFKEHFMTIDWLTLT